MTDSGARRCRLAWLPRTWARRLPSSSLPILWLLVALLALAAAAQPALAARPSLTDVGAGGNVTGDPDEGEHKPGAESWTTELGPLGVEVPSSPSAAGVTGATSCAGYPGGVAASARALPAAPATSSPCGPARARFLSAPPASWRWLQLIAVPVGGHLITPLPFLLLGNTRS